MEETIAIMLAAGKGTRMKSNKSKLVHKIYGKELVKRAVETTKKAGIDDVIAVVGYLKEQVQEVLGDSVKYAVQEEMKGTGHAVMQAAKYLEGKKGKVLVLNGDVPILRPETIEKLLNKSIENKECATLLSAKYENPNPEQLKQSLELILQQLSVSKIKFGNKYNQFLTNSFYKSTKNSAIGWNISSFIMSFFKENLTEAGDSLQLKVKKPSKHRHIVFQETPN